MPVNPLTATPVFLSFLTGSGLTGIQVSNLSSSLAVGLSSYLPTLLVQTVDVGTLGAGAGSGTVFLNPSVIVPSMLGAFASGGLNGIYSPVLATAIANAVSQCLSLALASTVSPSVGVGTGSGTVIPQSGFAYFSSAFKSSSFLGTYSDVLAGAVASGIDSSLPSSVVNVIIAGPTSPTPSSGIGTGFLS